MKQFSKGKALFILHVIIGMLSSHLMQSEIIIYIITTNFDFYIVNFPFLDGDVPCSTSYGVYVSQIFRNTRVLSHVGDFNTRN